MRSNRRSFISSSIFGIILLHLYGLCSANASSLSTSSTASDKSVVTLKSDVMSEWKKGNDEFPNQTEEVKIKSDEEEKLELQSIFMNWMKEFGKEYKTSEDFVKRRETWMKNHRYIENHNNQNYLKNEKNHPLPTYRLGHNQFSDLTLDEFNQFNFLADHSPGIITRTKPRNGNANLRHNVHKKDDGRTAATKTRRNLSQQPMSSSPESVNWVEEGAVTPIKNQGICGSCWAFSAIGAIESARYIELLQKDDDDVNPDNNSTVELISLSVQQLLDCDLEDHACSGGLMDNAFEYDESSDGLCSEDDYPYSMRRHYVYGCRRFMSQCTVVPNTKVSTFFDLNNTTEALKEAVAIQPVSVAIQATGDFQFYNSGVFNGKCGTNLDHGVVVIGYQTFPNNTDPSTNEGDEDEDEDYWIVRNSWGTTWGEDGYMKMSIKSQNLDDEGQCGIQMMATRPTLDMD